MNMLQFTGLKEGDIIRHVVTGDAYVVVLVTDHGAIAVRTLDVTNPEEWELVKKPGGPMEPGST